MRLKPGVRVHGVRPEIVLALLIVDQCYFARGMELVVTACIDGAHKRGSAHYAGNAVDLRTWKPGTSEQIDGSARQELRDDIQTRLGEDYDVIAEDDHIHLEYQPKAQY